VEGRGVFKTAICFEFLHFFNVFLDLRLLEGIEVFAREWLDIVFIIKKRVFHYQTAIIDIEIINDFVRLKLDLLISEKFASL